MNSTDIKNALFRRSDDNSLSFKMFSVVHFVFLAAAGLSLLSKAYEVFAFIVFWRISYLLLQLRRQNITAITLLSTLAEFKLNEVESKENDWK